MRKAIFFDAANTLLHKPGLLPAMQRVLGQRGWDVPLELLARNHRLVSEVIPFPDRTSRGFYEGFNTHFLRSVGIVAGPGLLDEVFAACSYLPWEPFADTAGLAGLGLPMGILSNWDTSLASHLARIDGAGFRWVLGSEEQGVRKPDPAFFARIVQETGLAPDEIVYVGDSLRLDIEPALQAGFAALLIDRDGLYRHGNVDRIDSLAELGARL
jgi:FMN phosphatase YigB (HAD superfamily)